MAGEVKSDSIKKDSLVILTGDRFARITDGYQKQFIRAVQLLIGGLEESSTVWAHEIVFVKIDKTWHPVELTEKHQAKAMNVIADMKKIGGNF